MPASFNAATWNAAAGDAKYKNTVDPDRFFAENSWNDFITLQEAGYDANRAATNNGFTILEAGSRRTERGTAAAYKAADWAPLKPKAAKAKLSGDGKRRVGTAMAVRFRHLRTGKVVKVLSAHAGHNGAWRRAHYKSTNKAKAQLLRLKKTTGGAAATVVAGDFNEMAQVMGPRSVGAGAKKRKTHSMGNNGQIGIFGGRFARSFKRRAYGSDHTAVALKAKV